MVSQKFVDVYFPGCDFVVSFSPRLFLVEQIRVVGKTQDGSCAKCGLERDSMVDMCVGTPFRQHPCSDVVKEYMCAEVALSNKGRILPVRWVKEVTGLDF